MRIQKLSAFGLAPLAATMLIACGGSDDGGGEAPKSLQERLFAGSASDFAEQQRLVRECMVEQGFEYTPIDNRDSNGGQQAFDTTSEDFVKEFGFGVSTMFTSGIDISSGEDPNQKYRNSLPEAQRKAYDIALYGQTFGDGSFSASGGAVAIPIQGSPGGEGAAQVTGPGGCLGEALKATGADQNPFDTGLFDDLQDLEERIKSDPKMVEAMKKWSQCMDDAGFDYRDRDQAIKELREEFGDLTGLRISGDGGGFVISVAPQGSSGPDGQAFDPLANVDKAKLAQLQDKEKRIALASLECSEKHVAKTEEQVRKRYEDEFLKEHPELGAE